MALMTKVKTDNGVRLVAEYTNKVRPGNGDRYSLVVWEDA